MTFRDVTEVKKAAKKNKLSLARLTCQRFSALTTVVSIIKGKSIIIYCKRVIETKLAEYFIALGSVYVEVSSNKYFQETMRSPCKPSLY